jgi:hypothetical protein
MDYCSEGILLMNDSNVSYKNGIPGKYYVHKSGSQIGYRSFFPGEISKCSKCSKEFLALKSQQKRLGNGKYCSNSCSKLGKKLGLDHRRKISEQKLGNKNPRYVSGKMTVQGYVLIKNRNHPNANGSGYVLEHRLVMSNFIGRPLRKDEVVHHKNKDRSDNRLENLEVLTRAEHSAHHSRSTNKNWVYLKERDIHCPHCKQCFNIEAVLKVS